MSVDNELYYLNRSLETIQQKLGWVPYRQWTLYHFQKLSDLIFESTGVLISADTFKRLVGKRKTKGDYYNPHRETKNAIAQYLGFEDWDGYKAENIEKPEIETQPVSEKKISLLKSKTKLVWYDIPLFLTILSGGAFFIFTSKTKAKLSISGLKGFAPYTIYQYHSHFFT